MDARMFAGGLVRRFQYLFWGLLFSIFAVQIAHAAPVVISVDHRVTVSYSKPQFDARKGILTVQARIKNRSEAALLSPLQLSFDQTALKNLRIQNAQGVGKDGRPYFDIKLPKGLLLAKASTDAIKVVIAVERKDKNVKLGNEKTILAALSNAQRVRAGAEIALLNLSAEPYALAANAGKQTVRFSVPVSLAGGWKKPVTVYLRRKGDKQRIAMNDLGKDGDYVAKDGIVGAYVQIDTRRIKPDSCMVYEAFTNEGRYELLSSSMQLCVSSFPIRVAAPNTSKPVVFSNGMKAVADEVLLYTLPTTSAATVRELARSINANVVGSILPLNLYQLRLSAPADSGRLAEIVARLSARSGIAGASVNALGEPAGHVSVATDPEFANQHGVKLVAGHPTLPDTYVWDAEAIGTGVTVVVADYGLDRSHPEFGIPGNCQLATDAVPGVPNTDCGGTNNDESSPISIYQWHGTRVAGVIAAKALNAQGIAGVAHGSKIYSYKVTSFALTDMDQIFIDVGNYVAMNGGASVINASFSGGPYSGALSVPGVNALCAAVNTAVTSGFGAIVVNAIGNNNANDYFYPARCNEHPNLLLGNRDRLIAVGNSASIMTRRCGNVDKDQRCQTDLDDATKLGSNYGSWVEIAAPGSDIRTTIPGGYAYATGTSFAAPIVSGAVAILKSCGVPLDSIQSILTSSATVKVPYPGSTPATETPRLDIYRALQSQAPTASTLSAAENYTEGVPLNLTDIVIASNLSGCATYTATMTLSDVAAGSLTTGTSGAVTSTFVGGVWTASGPMADVNALLAGVTFNPNPNYSSDFTITTSVADGISTINGSKAMHGLAVNSVPVAVNDALSSVAEDSGMRTIPFAVLTGNDDDGDPEVVQTLTITGVSNPVGGTVAINGANVEFTPSGNFSGTASFDYTVQDNGQTNGSDAFLSGTGSVSFTVTPVNDVPVAANDTLSNVAEDSGMRTIPFATLTGNDDDGDPEVVQTLIITAVSNPVGGAVAINGANVEFTPTGDFNGTASFDYTVQDNGQTNGGDAYLSSAGSASFTVTPVNDTANGSPSIIPIPPTIDPPMGGYRHAGDVIGVDTSLVSDIECPSGFGAGPTCSFTYQWSHRPPDVPPTGAGANGPQYTLDANDVNKFMGVCVDFTDTGGSPEHVCSSNDAFMVGDPHILTVDGLPYDFQGAGEFVALRGAGGMEIQLRMEAVPTAPPLPDDYTGLTSGVSVNTAVAARVGKQRVSYQPDTSPNAVPGTFVLRVDGVVKVLPAGGIDLDGGGRVLPQASGGIQIDFPDQTTLMVNTSSWPFYGAQWLHINVFHTSAYDGLMGARSKGSWLPRLSDGSAFGAKPASLHDRYVQLYEKFADSWRVNKDTTLFDYVGDTSMAKYTNKKWPTEKGPYAAANVPVAQPLPLKDANLACRDVAGKVEKANCVFDVRVMGNKELAKGHLLNQKIRLGAVNVVVRPAGKLNAKGEMMVTAAVVRHATVVPKVKGVRAVPAGAVQFMLGDKPLGKPVKLDAKGQAKLVVTRQNMERFNAGKLAITAQYQPARDKANVFLPSISRKLTPASPVMRGIR